MEVGPDEVVVDNAVDCSHDVVHSYIHNDHKAFCNLCCTRQCDTEYNIAVLGIDSHSIHPGIHLDDNHLVGIHPSDIRLQIGCQCVDYVAGNKDCVDCYPFRPCSGKFV